MTERVLERPIRPQISISRIVLPTEHGSWSFLLEPLIVGGAIAWSFAAPWIMLMVVAAFLSRQPLKVYWLARGNPAAAAVSVRFLLAFLAAAAIGLAGTIWIAPAALYPLALAGPIAAQQVFADLSRRSRSLVAELAGAAAVSSSAAMLAIGAGFSVSAAGALWLIFVCRAVPSILYVRNRLLLEKGKKFALLLPVTTHFIALGICAVLAFMGLASFLTVAVLAFLAVRSWFGLSPYRSKMKAMKIGIWEVVYGAVTVASMIIGYYLGV